ncbi:hypothetical protein IJS77_03620 [bacterium]|nr:hypothetical protein [bacterium]
MLNCHGLFNAQEVWYLYDNEKFKQRRFEIGICPYCDNKIYGLFEKEKKSGKSVFVRARDKKGKRLYDSLKSQIDYKKSDIARGTKANMAYVFGVNEEHKINGKTVILQKAVDFNGTQKVVKKINK